MRRVFISYARDDRQRVEALADRLRRLVDTVWFDSQLHGGEDWWVGILERIRECDIFVAVVSQASLNSEACRIEREYAAAVHRSILPVALDAVPSALPSDIATLQIVDFSEPGEQSVSDLARALLAVPEADPLPDPLPPEPDAPLSYLIDLVDLVGSRRELTKSEQMEILFRLEHGLESSDQDEREGARQVLLRMKARDDLAVSVGKTIDLLARENTAEAAADSGGSTSEPAPTPPAAPATPVAAAGVAAAGEATAPPVGEPPASTTALGAADQGPVDSKRRAITLAVAAAVVVALVGGIAWLVTSTGTGIEEPAPRVAPTTEPTAPPSEGPTTEPPPDPDPDPDQCQPPVDFFPGVVEPNTCNEAYGDNRVREWSWLLVSEGIIGDDPFNCNGCYTGPLVDRVVEWQAAVGLPADGVLDGDDYDCLWFGVCGPEFFSQPSYEGDCDLRPEGTVCLLFDDGYLWLVEDSIVDWYSVSIEGQPVDVAVGTVAEYWHVLDTDLVAVAPTADDLA